MEAIQDASRREVGIIDQSVDPYTVIRDFCDSFRGNNFREYITGALNLSAGQGADVFTHAAENVLENLANNSWVRDVSKIEYLKPLVSSSSQEKLWVATLNYDNALELAATALGINVDLGISAKTPSVKFNDESGFCLAKLHGSVNWQYKYEKMEWEIEDRPLAKPELIFGMGNKLKNTTGPYLRDLLFSFRMRLDGAIISPCVAMARDLHINYLIMNWLHADESRRLTVVTPCSRWLNITNMVFVNQ